MEPETVANTSNSGTVVAEEGRSLAQAQLTCSGDVFKSRMQPNPTKHQKARDEIGTHTWDFMLQF